MCMGYTRTTNQLMLPCGLVSLLCATGCVSFSRLFSSGVHPHHPLAPLCAHAFNLRQRHTT